MSILATTLDGAPGTVRGVIAADGAEASPVPMPFVAATVKVYAVPLVRPVTVNCVAVFASWTKGVHLLSIHEFTT